MAKNKIRIYRPTDGVILDRTLAYTRSDYKNTIAFRNVILRKLVGSLWRVEPETLQIIDIM